MAHPQTKPQTAPPDLADTLLRGRDALSRSARRPP
jgi:hypothetical protein